MRAPRTWTPAELELVIDFFCASPLNDEWAIGHSASLRCRPTRPTEQVNVALEHESPMRDLLPLPVEDVELRVRPRVQKMACPHHARRLLAHLSRRTPIVRPALSLVAAIRGGRFSKQRRRTQNSPRRCCHARKLIIMGPHDYFSGCVSLHGVFEPV